MANKSICHQEFILELIQNEHLYFQVKLEIFLHIIDGLI